MRAKGTPQAVRLFHASRVPRRRHPKIKGEARLGVCMAHNLRGRHHLMRRWKEQDGRAERDAKRHRRRRETFTFLGFTLYCTRNHRGNFKVGWRTGKSRLRRSLAKFHQLLQIIRHEPLKDQVEQINQVLRGHYAYYGIAGNVRSLLGAYRHVERYWREMLSSRSQKGKIRWEVFLAIKRKYPLQRPKLSLPYTRLKQYAVL
jgi:hypothetical protein